MGLLLAALGLVDAACVVPLPYDEEILVDAGANYPPVIENANPAMPGFATLLVGAGDVYTIDVSDNDTGDMIYTRIYRDYNASEPLNPFEVAPEPPSGSPLRIIELSTNTWCNQAARNTPLTFDVMVADREFIDDTYRVLPADAEASIRSWVLYCQESL